MKPKLLENHIDVLNFLDEEFGITKEQFLDVVQAGANARTNCTQNHPRSAGGFYSYSEATRQLRDIAIPLGWDWNEDENIASVFHKERNKRIAICNTEKGTGLRNYHPQPIIEKGDGVKRAVFTNEYVFQGILDSTLNPQPSAGSFWYVCIFSDGDIVRAELCCPVLNESGSFKDFHKRVILIGDENTDGGVRLRREIPGPDSDAGFEINVVRKQA